MSLIIDVETQDFRNALQAVTPHAEKESKIVSIHRVHISVTPHLVYVSATNRYSVALATASVFEVDGLTGSYEDDQFDLTPDLVREVLMLFKSKTNPEGEIGAALRIEVGDEEIRFTDISGLFPGQDLRPAPDEDRGRLPEHPAADPPVDHRRPQGSPAAGHLVHAGGLVRVLGPRVRRGADH